MLVYVIPTNDIGIEQIVLGLIEIFIDVRLVVFPSRVARLLNGTLTTVSNIIHQRKIAINIGRLVNLQGSRHSSNAI